jgi:hypothetical protein
MRRILPTIVVIVILVVLWDMFVRGNPGQLSDAEYSRYRQLAPPKLLYSCTRPPSQEWLIKQKQDCAQSGRAGCEETVNDAISSQTESVVDFLGGDRSASYEELLARARHECSRERGDLAGGRIEVLDSQKD